MQHETLIFTSLNVILTLGIAFAAQCGDSDGLRFASRE